MKIESSKRTVSIIIPALNEEDGITKTIISIPQGELVEMGYETQILVVDNGSHDGTAELAKKSGAEIISEPRKGYGYALKAGFAGATGEIIATADADATYPVEDIAKLVAALEKGGLDFITTNRYAYLEDGSMKALHRMGNAVLNAATKLLFQAKFRDSQSGMWVFRRRLLDNIVLRANSMAISEEIKIEACYYLKCRWQELPISYRARVGVAKLKSWRDGLGNLAFLVKKRYFR